MDKDTEKAKNLGGMFATTNASRTTIKVNTKTQIKLIVNQQIHLQSARPCLHSQSKNTIDLLMKLSIRWNILVTYSTPQGIPVIPVNLRHLFPAKSGSITLKEIRASGCE